MDNYRSCPYCSGSGKDPFRNVLCQVCNGNGEVEQYTEGKTCPVCSGRGRDPFENRPCRKCKGFGMIYKGPLVLFYVSGERQYTDRRTVEDILKQLSGNVLICEAHFGKGTLDTIKNIPNRCTVHVLMAHQHDVSSGDLQRFKAQYPQFEFKKMPDLHDRYVLDGKGLMILGHGLKDLGSKESFVIFLEKQLISDTYKEIEEAFNARWRSGIPVI